MERMYPRREFPVEVLPPILDTRGRPNKRAIKMRFSACGKPHARPEVMAAMIKAGLDVNTAFRLTILASHIEGHHFDAKNGPDFDCVKEICQIIISEAEGEHAKRHPTGKCAEDLAARIERRPSRWGTREFHIGTAEENRTAHYPFRG